MRVSIFSSFGTLFFAGFGAGVFLDFFGVDFGVIACTCSRTLLTKFSVKRGDFGVFFDSSSDSHSEIKSHVEVDSTHDSIDSS